MIWFKGLEVDTLPIVSTLKSCNNFRESLDYN